MEADEKTITCQFSVTDTGIGIQEDKLSEIFHSFTQADNSISREFGGTGLGLTISNSLLEYMGSSLKVESTFGEGSTFFFIIRFDRYVEGM
jgi:signal transduction histidine kinase